MAFRQPTAVPGRQLSVTTPIQLESTIPTLLPFDNQIEHSQEWILFSPQRNDSSAAYTDTTSTQRTSQTAGLSRLSDIGSYDTAARSGRLEPSVLEEEGIEDRELDSLDEGLHAFREPSYQISSNQSPVGVLPTHDGLGTFPASSATVQEQLWQHEQYNPKRKFEGAHRRRSSIQRRLDTIEELEHRANDDKMLRIEKGRLEQSEALVEEIERETRRRIRKESARFEPDEKWITQEEDLLGTTPKASYLQKEPSQKEEVDENEPFWRRITRRFIRDVIGIDEPLLSVILGESLPPEAYEQPQPSSTLFTIPEQKAEAPDSYYEDNWRNRLLHRIARELGVLVNQLSPHPGAFNTYFGPPTTEDYAGIPITQTSPRTNIGEAAPPSLEQSGNPNSSSFNPTFSPTIQNPTHSASWGLEEEPTPSTTSATQAADAERLRREREYWERELDVKMVFRFLKNRFTSNPSPRHTSPPAQSLTPAQESTTRAAIIRHHHPLVARAHQSAARIRRDSRMLVRRTSSCASESVKSSRRASVARSGGSSRNYWDLGGSIGTGSIVASGGLMGAWGEG